jgi:hypothetical protein
MSNIGKNMMLYTSAFRNVESFSMIPVSNDSPYVEAMYDPTSNILAVISKVTKNSFHMIPRLNEEGQPQKLKFPNKETGKTFKEQRVDMETFSEFYITDKKEIKDFINIFAINADTFDYTKYTEVETKKVKTSPILTP